MTTKKRVRLTSRHRVQLSDVVSASSSVDVFGQLVDGVDVPADGRAVVHPTRAGSQLAFARIVGYVEAGQCVRLLDPQIVAMPEPTGRADACGWNPAQFVVWKGLAKNWTTLHLRVSSSSLGGALTLGRAQARADAEEKLRFDQIDAILSDCIPLAGGCRDPIDMAASLQRYGLDADGVLVFSGDVVGNDEFGVRRFQFRLAAGALNGLSPSTTLNDVSNLIRNNAVPS